MSEAQAIEMLSGHQDFDRFIEEYRLDGRPPSRPRAGLDPQGRGVLYGAPERAVSRVVESSIILASYPRLRK